MSREVVTIENARIIFRNFSGIETDMNREGDRNFCVILDDQETAMMLKEQGWNVKELVNRETQTVEALYLPVALRFDKYPPKVFTVSSRGVTTPVDESTVGLLDNADIAFVDLQINPYHWSGSTGSGVKAYLKSLYVNLEEDPLAEKYAQQEHPRDDAADLKEMLD